jgi:hypothetical protein
MQLHRGLRVDACKLSDIALLIEHGFAVRPLRDVLQGKILDISTPLLLVLLVRQL